MGLITEFVEIEIASCNLEKLESLGYEIPKYYNEQSKTYKVKRGTKIWINVRDSTDGSPVKIECVCDECGEIKKTQWNCYRISIWFNENKYLCQTCYNRLIGIKKLLEKRFEEGITFYQWCYDNEKTDFLSRWDFERNEISPDEVGSSSSKKFYFLCPNGVHESRLLKLNAITSNGKGNEGISEIICLECNSFGYVWPDKLHLWGDNEKSPYDCRNYSSVEDVWWLCENGVHEQYKRTINRSIGCGFRCPKCVKENSRSILAQKVRDYLFLFEEYEILEEHDCTTIAINPKTGKRMPFDYEIYELGILIECQGDQHLRPCGWVIKNAKEKNITPMEELKIQQDRDFIKKEWAINGGYYYLEICSYHDNKKEDYKKLIDNSISERLIQLGYN